MHSSTSSSSGPAARSGPSQGARGLRWLILLILIFFSGLEAFSPILLRRIDPWSDLTPAEYRGIRNLGPRGPEGGETILFVGNSLIYVGLDIEALDATLGGHRVHRLSILGTQYFDWRFGLRRLFRTGHRPSVVVLCLAVEHLISASTNGSEFGGDQMDLRDLWMVKRETGLNNTALSEQVFAHCSRWRAGKATVRGWAIGNAVPGLRALKDRFRPALPALPSEEAVRAMATQRLAILKQTVTEGGAKLVMLIPPSESGIDRTGAVKTAGEAVGVPVLVPYPPLSMPNRMYLDGFHLNPEGKALFTNRVAQAIQALLADPSFGAEGDRRRAKSP